jgi:hypothetical protein
MKTDWIINELFQNSKHTSIYQDKFFSVITNFILYFYVFSCFFFFSFGCLIFGITERYIRAELKSLIKQIVTFFL